METVYSFDSFSYYGFKRKFIQTCNSMFSDNTDITVCFVTTDIKWQKKFDMILEPDHLNGLKTKSLVRLNKIATLDVQLVSGILGYLSKFQLHELNANLRGLFALDDPGKNQY